MLMSPPQSGTVTFKPRARLLKLIGAELISDEVVALTELVKNAYDADASRVEILFKNVNHDDGEIVIRDDGHGMSLDALLRHWMEPAGTSKSGAHKRHSKRGRRYLGEKGVGRFAVDKLASQLELVTRTAGSDKELVAHFDWDAFDCEDHLLADIEHEWSERHASELAGAGTILRLRGLRVAWNERMFRRLCTRLGRLRSPFESAADFTINIDSDDFPDYAGEVRGGYLDHAPYRLDATFDGEETISVSLNDGEPSKHFYRQANLTCGAVRIRLSAFDLETDSLARIGPRAEVRAWLKEWSGVSIFRDGFRLWPYGEPQDDWLRLDQRRVNNPVVCLSNNQVVGFVEIGSESNPDLRDQTNREGLINNQAFTDLRLLMYHVLHIIEAARQDVRHPAQPKRQVSAVLRERESEVETIAHELDRLAHKAASELVDDLQRVAKRLREHANKESQRYRTLHENYAELAALGHTASSLIVDIQQMTDLLRTAPAINAASSSNEDSWPEEQNLQQFRKTADLLHQHLSRLVPSNDSGSARRRAIDIVKELKTASEYLRPILERNRVTVFKLDVVPELLVRTEMRPENFQRLIHILVDNAVDWSGSVKRPEICVTVRKLADDCELTVADNGAGISDEIFSRVFEPGFSWKENGRGMGLAIARSLVELHGGTIDVLRPLSGQGALFRILLPLKRARATVV